MSEQQKKEASALYCNCCGRKLAAKDGVLREDALCVTKEWGYFSKKDLQLHHFLMCEDCYDTMIAAFQIPVEKREKSEAM